MCLGCRNARPCLTAGLQLAFRRPDELIGVVCAVRCGAVWTCGAFFCALRLGPGMRASVPFVGQYVRGGIAFCAEYRC